MDHENRPHEKRHQGRLSSAVDRAFHASFCYRFFRTDDRTDSYFRESLICHFLRPHKLSHAFRLFKNAFAKKCENSVLCGVIESFYEKLPSCSLRSVGVLFLYFSAYSLAITALRMAAERHVGRYTDNFISAAVMLLISCLFLCYKGSVAEFVSRSRILSCLSRTLLFTRREMFDTPVYRPSNGVLVLLGTFLGVATYFVPVKRILLLMLFAVLVLSLFKVPENGMIFSVLFCPFLSLPQLSTLILLAFLGYMFKVLRGKRNFHTGSFDSMMLLMTLILFCGCFTTSSRTAPEKEGLWKLAVLSAYFIFRNCVRSEEMLRKCVSAMTLSGGIAGLCCVWERLNSNGSILRLERRLNMEFPFAPGSLFEDSIAFGEFMLLLIPFAVMCFAAARSKNEGLFALLCLAVCFIPLLQIHSKGILLALMVGVLVYIVASFHNPIASVVTVVLVSLAFSAFITHSAFLGSDRFFNVNDYKESILLTATDIIRENPLAGIGIGSDNFSRLFRMYTHFGDSQISHCYNVYLQLLAELGIFGALFLACMAVCLVKILLSAISRCRKDNNTLFIASLSAASALSSMLMRGLTSHIFSDYRVLFIFSAMIGCVVAVSQMSRKGEWKPEGEDY